MWAEPHGWLPGSPQGTWGWGPRGFAGLCALVVRPPAGPRPSGGPVPPPRPAPHPLLVTHLDARKRGGGGRSLPLSGRLFCVTKNDPEQSGSPSCRSPPSRVSRYDLTSLRSTPRPHLTEEQTEAQRGVWLTGRHVVGRPSVWIGARGSPGARRGGNGAPRKPRGPGPQRPWLCSGVGEGCRQSRPGLLRGLLGPQIPGPLPARGGRSVNTSCLWFRESGRGQHPGDRGQALGGGGRRGLFVLRVTPAPSAGPHGRAGGGAGAGQGQRAPASPDSERLGCPPYDSVIGWGQAVAP